MPKKINVFLLTGFLGSGKTTVLNQLLAQFHPENNVVVENEFGKVNIDSQLISSSYDSVYEITNGCICCTMDEDLSNTLNEIAKNKENIDNLFIETTGVADAGNLANIFMQENVAKLFDLKKVVCMVDVECFEDHMQVAVEPLRQVIASDLVVLNKTELVQKKYLKGLRKTLSELNPNARITETENGQLDKKLLFEKNSYEKIILHPEISGTNPHKINNVLFESEDVLEYWGLYHILSVTLSLYYSQVFRVKGFVRCVHSEEENPEIKTYVVHSTGKTLSITPIEKEDFEKNQLVFIGRELKTATVERILRGAVAKTVAS